MYHYLKWAALSYFIKRNARYLLWVLMGIVVIFLTDAIYQDMADYAVKTDQRDKIGIFLTIKWVVILLCSGLILFSIMKLGRWQASSNATKNDRKRPLSKKEYEDDAIRKRLEKFKYPHRLRHPSDRIIEKKKRGKG